MLKMSVVIPVYNVERYLENMINSILMQNFDNYELLLIDDGSTDRSGLICDEIADKDDRVRVFHITNGGVSNARNFGLAKATGEYIYFADSDDFLERGMFNCFATIVDKEQPDIVMCGSLQINEKRNTSTVIAPRVETYLKDRDCISKYLDQIPLDEMKCLIHYVWNKWYKREFLLKKHLLFSPRLSLGEDYVFNCTAIKAATDIYMVPNTFYHYFIRKNSLVSAFQAEPWESRQMLFDAHKALYESYGIWKTNEKAILMEEGKMCFVALRSVNSKRCTLSNIEKNNFLKRMSTSKQMSNALYYLENSDKKLHKLWLFLMRKFGILGIKVVLLADYVNRVKEEK